MHNNSNDDSETNERTSLLHATNDSINNDARELNEQRASSGISWYFAVFLIVNAALGAGLLNFSKAFDNAGGILISTIIQTVYFQLSFSFTKKKTFNLRTLTTTKKTKILVVVISGALIILAYCTDNKQSANFQDGIQQFYSSF